MWNKLKEQLNILKIEKKKLCLITNSDKFVSKELFLDAIASAIQGGVDVVQFNEKSFSDNVLAEIAKKIRILCDEFGATFVVNSRCDIALISEADGVHLEEGCVSVQDAREILGENAIIGVSAKSVEDVISAYNDGADYVTAALDLSGKKKNNCLRSDDLRWIKENVEIPVFVTGKIDLDNIEEFMQSGVEKFALTDSVMYAQIPEETAREIAGLLK